MVTPEVEQHLGKRFAVGYASIQDKKVPQKSLKISKIKDDCHHKESKKVLLDNYSTYASVIYL